MGILKKPFVLAAVSLFLFTLASPGITAREDQRYWVTVKAATKKERAAAAALGLAIDEVRDGVSVGGVADAVTVRKLRENGFSLEQTPLEFFIEAFPPEDAAYHDYEEMTAEMRALAQDKPELISFYSIGASVQGRQLWALRFNKDARNNAKSEKPGAVFMGTHHAREHLSTEVPLLLAKYLAANYGKDRSLMELMDTRDIFIIPMVNPDGVEYDISRGRYRMWRKNMRDNGGSLGVDLNRNYGFKWASGGSSSNPGSDVYHGPSPFSEPETQAVKRFVETHENIRTLLSFHTFSELILYPWGHKDEEVENSRDLAVFKTMARTMAKWNGYKPQKSSDLYIASGDTTDWAYGERGIFAFTFELTPKSMWGGGGFYPGPGVIQSTFEANLKPCLYLITTAGNPYSVIGNTARVKSIGQQTGTPPVRLR